MRRSILFTLLVALIAALPLFAAPTQVKAAKEVVITITEVEFNQFLAKVRKPATITKAEANFIDGGIILAVSTTSKIIPIYQEHYGVLIRDGKIFTEAGVFVIPGIGGLGYEDVKKLIPALVPILDNNAKVLGKYVLDRVKAKAGTRYTPVSVATSEDKIVIVVTK